MVLVSGGLQHTGDVQTVSDFAFFIATDGTLVITKGSETMVLLNDEVSEIIAAMTLGNCGSCGDYQMGGYHNHD